MTMPAYNGIQIASVAVLLGLSVATGDRAAAMEADQSPHKRRNVDAVQTVHQRGIPHIDGRGALLMKYDPKRSFFPLAITNVPLPGNYYAGNKVDWRTIKDAGINTIWAWPNDPKLVVKAGAANGLKVLLFTAPGEEALKQLKDEPALLGILWTDEPSARLGANFDMDRLFAQFVAFRDTVHKIMPSLPVFVNDGPWSAQPYTHWWLRWNTSGDISCHDNYPIMNRGARAKSIGAGVCDIPQSVSLAVAANKGQKPVWLTLGAFEEPGNQVFPYRYPTPEQLRASVYAAIIHGATGILYFALDSYVARDSGVIGIAPDPKVTYTPVPKREGDPHRTPATPIQLIKARALWDAMAQINKEIAELTPSILSPTVGQDFPYAVDVAGTAPTPSPIRCLLKPHPDGGFVLLTVNMDDAVLKATYTMPSVVRSAELMFENQESCKLSTDGKSFAVAYDPFDSHVVRLKR
jgi:hypothetical protein